MSVQPKRFFECLLPVSACNLKCPYCYIIQEGKREMKLADLPYSPEHIAKALRKERVGGTCWISICGAGETLVQPEAVGIIKCLLAEGHYVNVTTNGTLTARFNELISACGDTIKRLHVSFSLHYLELKKRGLLDAFFDNVIKIRDAGASILVQINMCDEYSPYIDEIKSAVKEKVGAYPQAALTRDESTIPMKIWTVKTASEYFAEGESFCSPLFRFTFDQFNKKHKEFCYAGDWSGVLNLQTGWLKKCYANAEGQNIFEDIDRPIDFEAVGKECRNLYCVNSSHFISLGVIPSIKAPTYAELRNRKEANWYSEDMEKFLSHKLEESNKKYPLTKRIKTEMRLTKTKLSRCLRKLKLK